MNPKHHNRTLIDANTQTMRCLHCLAHAPIPLGDLSYAVTVIKAWDRAHRRCKPGDASPTWQSVPRCEVTTETNRAKPRKARDA